MESIIAFIVVPLAIFIISGIAGGVMLAIKLTVYFARSREAQESTAKSMVKVTEQLDQFIGTTTNRLNDHGERISVLEDRTGIERERR